MFNILNSGYPLPNAPKRAMTHSLRIWVLPQTMNTWVRMSIKNVFNIYRHELNQQQPYSIFQLKPNIPNYDRNTENVRWCYLSKKRVKSTNVRQYSDDVDEYLRMIAIVQIVISIRKIEITNIYRHIELPIEFVCYYRPTAVLPNRRVDDRLYPNRDMLPILEHALSLLT